MFASKAVLMALTLSGVPTGADMGAVQLFFFGALLSTSRVWYLGAQQLPKAEGAMPDSRTIRMTKTTNTQNAIKARNSAMAASFSFIRFFPCRASLVHLLTKYSAQIKAFAAATMGAGLVLGIRIEDIQQVLDELFHASPLSYSRLVLTPWEPPRARSIPLPHGTK